MQNKSTRTTDHPGTKSPEPEGEDFEAYDVFTTSAGSEYFVKKPSKDASRSKAEDKEASHGN